MRAQTLCFTGKIVVDGEWMVRAECAREAKQRGVTTKTDFSSGITLVVHDDLAGKQVSDTRRNYSGTLVAAERERQQGHHVHVVDGDGLPPVKVAPNRPLKSEPTENPTGAAYDSWLREQRAHAKGPASSRKKHAGAAAETSLMVFVPEGQGAVPWHRSTGFAITDVTA
ncbi:hypothetical protein ACFYVM_15810 [Streptomyces sp. NPDC003280]|uniref:hypothetical protein n=1 Tax=Streptomyces sp. NPDC003280 TaxID=3364680 RepID=UPI0036BB5961